MNKKNKFLSSFKYAAKGILTCLKLERNMRFHLIFCIYVFFFSFIMEISSTELALVFLASALVFISEMLNTAIEKLCDFVCKDKNQNIGKIKDICAGAVLVSAVISICVGVTVLYKPDKLLMIFNIFVNNPLYIILLVLSLVASIIYITCGFSFKNKKD